MHLLLPLASSLLYVIAAMFLKQSASRGVDVWRTAFVCNGVTAVLFLTLWPLGGEIPGPARFHQPLLVALLFIGGHILTFLALKTGDVSVATPVMGSKVILVAFFTTLLGAGHVSWTLWLGAILSAFGIACLNRAGKAGASHHFGRTLGLSLAAAASYAVFDVLVMSWSPAWGVGRFLPITMLISGLLSFAFLPFASRGPRREDPPFAGTRPLWFGALFIALQALIFVSTLARFGDATAINVIYSLRGLWSVLAVWWLGHWFANADRTQGAATFRARLVGAACLCGAVALVFV